MGCKPVGKVVIIKTIYPPQRNVILIHSYVSFIMKIQKAYQINFFFEIIYHKDSKKKNVYAFIILPCNFLQMYFYISFQIIVNFNLIIKIIKSYDLYGPW